MIMINLTIEQQFRNEIPKPEKTGLDWYLFCYFLNKFRDSKFLEIGVGHGGSLFSMLAFSDNVTAIDNWAYGWDKKSVEKYLNNTNKSVKFIDKDSEIVDKDDLDLYTFVHIDANKKYKNVANDLMLGNAISDTLICVDDYMNSMWPEVTWAVDDFLKMNKQWKVILIGNHQIFLAKKKIDVKEILFDFPINLIEDTIYLTYGNLPKYTMPFISNGHMKYTWHKNILEINY